MRGRRANAAGADDAPARGGADAPSRDVPRAPRRDMPRAPRRDMPDAPSRDTTGAPPRDAADIPVRDADFVESLARGLDVLGAFGRGRERMTLSAVAARTGLPRGTARRFLHTLSVLGFVASDGRLFRLTPKVLGLGGGFLAASALVSSAGPAIRRVSEALRESCSMAVLDGGDVVYVARVETNPIFSARIEVGTRLPATATALGRVLLAALDEPALERWMQRHPPARWNARSVVEPAALQRRIAEARRQRFAVVDGELELGVRSVAVPVLDAEGRVAAAINVGTSAGRASLVHLRRAVLPLLRAAAEEVRLAALAAATGSATGPAMGKE